METVKTEHGYICIANSGFPFILGGIRMLPDVTIEEVEKLALAMEYKLASFGIPIGGAKAGVRGEMMNLNHLTRFLQEIREYLTGSRGVTFVTGPDMGTSEDLYLTALQELGLDSLVRKGLLSETSREYGLPMDNVVTGLGVVVAAEEIFAILSPFMRGQDPLAGKRYALEGFGKVSTGISRILQNRCRLVAVSTMDGSVFYNEDCEYTKDGGFDIEKLIELREKHGDRFVYHLGLEVRDTVELFSADADFIIPGARTEVIDHEVAEKIVRSGTVQAIVPASNYPYSEEGLSILEKNGVICCPDFLSNPGAVLAAMTEFTTMDVKDPQETAMDIVHQAISMEMRDLLTQGIACGCAIGPNRNMETYHSLYKLAIDRAVARRQSTQRKMSISEIADDVFANYSIF